MILIKRILNSIYIIEFLHINFPGSSSSLLQGYGYLYNKEYKYILTEFML